MSRVEDIMRNEVKKKTYFQVPFSEIFRDKHEIFNFTSN